MNEIINEIEDTLIGQKKYKNAAENIKLYIHELAARDLPPLIDISYLSEFCEIDLGIISAAIAEPHLFYRTFEIPKKRGGMRTVDAPLPSLLVCQKWISKNILEKIFIHDNATAYKKNVNLLSNITPHLAQKQLLKIDLKDFFHSIKINRVISVFKNMGYLPKMSYELASLCCLHGRLPQGSAASPYLSNIIAKRMDKRLSSLASKYNLNYTRYSDDMTFSGEVIPTKLISLIELIIKSESFQINSSKTRLYTGSGKRIITGISVTDKFPKLPRTTKRKIRQTFYALTKKGNIEENITADGNDVFFLESLKGKLSFWQFIEPETPYPQDAIKTLKEMYG